MQILPATHEDIPALCGLLAELFAQEHEFSPDAALQGAGLLRIIDQPETGVILVAREAGRARGMVNLLYTVSTALGARVALLEDMVVTASARGRGIGQQLLTAALATATAAGCRRITLLTDGDNLAAQRFYQSQGFAPSTMLPLRRSLP